MGITIYLPFYVIVNIEGTKFMCKKFLFVFFAVYYLVNNVSHTEAINIWCKGTREHLFGEAGLCSEAANKGALDLLPACANGEHVGHMVIHNNGERCPRDACDLQDKKHRRVFIKNNIGIRDQGFRWKNSLNINIGGNPINSWRFLKVRDVTADGLSDADLATWTEDSNPDLIHSQLAKITDKIKNSGAAGISATTAAITLVIEKEDHLRAFSSVLNVNGVIYAAKNQGTQPFGDRLNYITHDGATLFNNTNATLESNLPGTPAFPYQCTEGKIISHLLQDDKISLKKAINKLLKKAKTDYPGTSYNDIKLIILHIGTSMDPCAVCTRCLVGLSKYFNEKKGGIGVSANDSKIRDLKLTAIQGGDVETDYLEIIDGEIPNTSKFLVEVSSNGHYAIPAKEIYNFSTYGFGACSHTECAGHDGHEHDLINIILNNPADRIAVVECNGIVGVEVNNWNFSYHYPSYIVFARTNPANNIQHAPNAPDCGVLDGVRHIGHTGIFSHPCINNLQLIQ